MAHIREIFADAKALKTLENSVAEVQKIAQVIKEGDDVSLDQRKAFILNILISPYLAYEGFDLESTFVADLEKFKTNKMSVADIAASFSNHVAGLKETYKAQADVDKEQATLRFFKDEKNQEFIHNTLNIMKVLTAHNISGPFSLKFDAPGLFKNCENVGQVETWAKNESEECLKHCESLRAVIEGGIAELRNAQARNQQLAFNTFNRLEARVLQIFADVRDLELHENGVLQAFKTLERVKEGYVHLVVPPLGAEVGAPLVLASRSEFIKTSTAFVSALADFQQKLMLALADLPQMFTEHQREKQEYLSKFFAVLETKQVSQSPQSAVSWQALEAKEAKRAQSQSPDSAAGNDSVRNQYDVAAEAKVKPLHELWADLRRMFSAKRERIYEQGGAEDMQKSCDAIMKRASFHTPELVSLFAEAFKSDAGLAQLEFLDKFEARLRELATPPVAAVSAGEDVVPGGPAVTGAVISQPQPAVVEYPSAAIVGDQVPTQNSPATSILPRAAV